MNRHRLTARNIATRLYSHQEMALSPQQPADASKVLNMMRLKVSNQKRQTHQIGGFFIVLQNQWLDIWASQVQ